MQLTLIKCIDIVDCLNEVKKRSLEENDNKLNPHVGYFITKNLNSISEIMIKDKSFQKNFQKYGEFLRKRKEIITSAANTQQMILEDNKATEKDSKIEINREELKKEVKALDEAYKSTIDKHTDFLNKKVHLNNLYKIKIDNLPKLSENVLNILIGSDLVRE